MAQIPEEVKRVIQEYDERLGIVDEIIRTGIDVADLI